VYFCEQKFAFFLHFTQFIKVYYRNTFEMKQHLMLNIVKLSIAVFSSMNVVKMQVKISPETAYAFILVLYNIIKF
jgi:hypothetical protein